MTWVKQTASGKPLWNHRRPEILNRSPTFGQWVGVELIGHNHWQLWISSGFAHGFMEVSNSAHLLYRTTEYYAPDCECCIASNDQTLNIQWPSEGEPLISVKDAHGVPFEQGEVFA